MTDAEIIALADKGVGRFRRGAFGLILGVHAGSGWLGRSDSWRIVAAVAPFAHRNAARSG